MSSAISASSHFPNASDPYPPSIEKWNYLISVIGVLAFSHIFIPYADLGMAVGGCVAAAAVLAHNLSQKMGWLHSDPNSKFETEVLSHLFTSSVLVPILEEGLFRGIVQPLTARSIVWIFPHAATLFLGPIEVTSAVAILATAVLFGGAHLFNAHKNTHCQAALATIAGIAYGVLSVHYGLTSAMVAHVFDNTCLTCLALEL